MVAVVELNVFFQQNIITCGSKALANGNVELKNAECNYFVRCFFGKLFLNQSFRLLISNNY